MARSKEEDRAITLKVNLLMSEGYDRKQAQAIAFRMFRDGELRIYKQPRQSRGSLQKKVKTAAKLMALAKILRGK
jgi:hypothetical protein